MENLISQSLLFILLLRGFAFGSVDYCKYHLFENMLNKNVMHFSKENSEMEYAVIDGFKSLHCCSHGYRSIEWFKDGIPYPWSTEVSTLIISPESGNQTIYSPVISKTDHGRYWCIVRNDTDSLRHDVYLTVSGEWPHTYDPPKPTYKPKDQLVALGEDARFYCEGFIGNVSSSDGKNYITWRKLEGNNSILDNDRIRQEIVFREENQVLGSYLIVKNVRMEDYGVYGCFIRNTGDPVYFNVSLITEDGIVHRLLNKSYPLERTLLYAVLLILSATISTLFLVFFRSHFRVIYQQFFQKNCSKRAKPYDILIVYHEEEKDIALSKIVFTLQSSYHYTCNVQPVTFGKLGCKDLREKAHNSKRVIVLLSRALAESDWSCRKLTIILQEVIGIHPRIITVLLSQLPLYEPPEEATSLRNLLQRVYCVEYTEAKVHKFWDLLTLGLPSRNTTSETGENVELV